MDVVFEHNFSTLEASRFVTSFAVSPNNPYLALGGGDQTRRDEGILLVIDLSNGEFLLDLEGVEPICSLYWANNESIIYGQSDGVACLPFRSHQPSDLLVWRDVLDGTTQTISLSSLTSLYFVPLPSEGQPSNQAPTANAGQDVTIIAPDGISAQIIVDGSGSFDTDGTIVAYSWSEGGVEIANTINPSLILGVGTHTILLTVTDAAGESQQDEL